MVNFCQSNQRNNRLKSKYMEIRQFLFLIRKWTWLLLIGGILGGLVGYITSLRTPKVYQTSTRVMVSQYSSIEGYDYSVWREIQLAQTYSHMLTAGPVIEQLSDSLGYPVSPGQINVRQIEDSHLLNIQVKNGDPVRSADIANNLVEVFNNYNENIQSDRFEESEELSQAQIQKLEGQISALQDELVQSSRQDQAIEESQLQQQIADLKIQLDNTELEIINTERILDSFFPTPFPTSTPQTSFSSTATPIPTPTLSPSAEIDYKETQNQLDQLNTLRELYKEAYANLLVIGNPDDSTSQNTINPSRVAQIQITLELYQRLYTELLNNYEMIRLARLRNTPNIVQIDKANVPFSPIQPQPVRSAFLGFVVGMLFAGAVVFVVEYLDDTIKTPDDVSDHLGLPVIGLIGDMDQIKSKKKNLTGIHAIDNPLSPITEAFRSLRTNLNFYSVDHSLGSLLVTSPNPSEGKTTIVVNLAAILAQTDQHVYLVDADLRRPSVHRLFDLPNRSGLSDVFKTDASISEISSDWNDLKIKIITSGALPPNPTELLGSERMKRFLEEISSLSDIVIMDTPPAVVTDPVALGAQVDGVIIVVEPGKTKIGQVQVLIEQLYQGNANILGIVLNPIPRQLSSFYGGYRYYSRYYSKEFGDYFGDIEEDDE
jgi:capsular exopolysaccharide synthesis family protein